jgi:hypothetical protein
LPGSGVLQNQNHVIVIGEEVITVIIVTGKDINFCKNER